MPTNLDISALRSFVAISDCGGVTAAAEQMHLTQSAVSMQVKRLEQQMDNKLLQRKGRGVTLTPVGEQLLSYARRIVALNDETWSRLTREEFEGQLSLGIPVDVMKPEVPEILKRCKTLFPRLHINLISSLTRDLKHRLAAAEVDIILATDYERGEGAETLVTETNDWYGAIGGSAYLTRPLPLSMCKNCAMRGAVIRALDEADVPWINIGDTDSEDAVDTMLAADLAVTAKIRATTSQCEKLPADVLPELAEVQINMYVNRQNQPHLVDPVAEVIREVFAHRGSLVRR